MNALARYLYGVAAIGFGICALVWHAFPNWQILKPLGDTTFRAILTDLVGIIAVVGGAAVVWERTARVGALVLSAMFAGIAVLGVPLIITQPLVYNGYGNLCEQLSLAAGAAMLARNARLARIGYYAFGVCVISYGLEQLFYLSATASFVPKWVPPGQMFWAIATTIAFFAAAVAILTGIRALLAACLNTAMIVGFGLLVWVPALFADARSYGNWSETIETFGIAACAWIVANYIERGRAQAT